jgi:tetratricopeptide (TPR) repeat protein
MRKPFWFLFLILFGAATLFGQGGPLSAQNQQNGPGARPTIEGEVRLPNGNPVPFVYLRLEPEGMGGRIQTATTDSSGYYSFSGYFVGGNFNIVINVQGFQPIRRLVMVTAPLTEVNFTLEPLPGAAKPKTDPLVSVKHLQIPPKARAQYRRGVDQMDQGKYAEAEASFRRAVQIDPKFAAGYRRLSAVYARQGRFAEANRAINRARGLEKNNAENYAYLGYLYLQEKQTGKAELAFQQSIRVNEDDWFAQLELGRLRYQQKNYRGAYPHLVIAHKVHPQLLSVHMLLYDDLIRLDNRKDALAELDHILELFPKCSQAPKLRKMRAALEISMSHPQE